MSARPFSAKLPRHADILPYQEKSWQHTWIALLIAALLAIPTAATQAGEKETPLGREMEGMAASYKTLRKELQQPDPAKVDAYRKLVARLIQHAEAAQKFEPTLAAQQQGGARQKMVADFHQSMRHFAGRAKALDAALQQQRFDDAVKLLAELNELKKQGHKKFQD